MDYDARAIRILAETIKYRMRSFGKAIPAAPAAPAAKTKEDAITAAVEAAQTLMNAWQRHPPTAGYGTHDLDPAQVRDASRSVAWWAGLATPGRQDITLMSFKSLRKLARTSSDPHTLAVIATHPHILNSSMIGEYGKITLEQFRPTDSISAALLENPHTPGDALTSLIVAIGSIVTRQDVARVNGPAVDIVRNPHDWPKPGREELARAHLPMILEHPNQPDDMASSLLNLMDGFAQCNTGIANMELFWLCRSGHIPLADMAEWLLSALRDGGSLRHGNDSDFKINYPTLLMDMPVRERDLERAITRLAAQVPANPSPREISVFTGLLAALLQHPGATAEHVQLAEKVPVPGWRECAPTVAAAGYGKDAIRYVAFRGNGPEGKTLATLVRNNQTPIDVVARLAARDAARFAEGIRLSGTVAEAYMSRGSRFCGDDAPLPVLLPALLDHLEELWPVREGLVNAERVPVEFLIDQASPAPHRRGRPPREERVQLAELAAYLVADMLTVDTWNALDDARRVAAVARGCVNRDILAAATVDPDPRVRRAASRTVLTAAAT